MEEWDGREEERREEWDERGKLKRNGGRSETGEGSWRRTAGGVRREWEAEEERREEWDEGEGRWRGTAGGVRREREDEEERREERDGTRKTCMTVINRWLNNTTQPILLSISQYFFVKYATATYNLLITRVNLVYTVTHTSLKTCIFACHCTCTYVAPHLDRHPSAGLLTCMYWIPSPKLWCTH